MRRRKREGRRLAGKWNDTPIFILMQTYLFMYFVLHVQSAFLSHFPQAALHFHVPIESRRKNMVFSSDFKK